MAISVAFALHGAAQAADGKQLGQQILDCSNRKDYPCLIRLTDDYLRDPQKYGVPDPSLPDSTRHLAIAARFQVLLGENLKKTSEQFARSPRIAAYCEDILRLSAELNELYTEEYLLANFWLVGIKLVAGEKRSAALYLSETRKIYQIGRVAFSNTEIRDWIGSGIAHWSRMRW